MCILEVLKIAFVLPRCEAALQQGSRTKKSARLKFQNFFNANTKFLFCLFYKVQSTSLDKLIAILMQHGKIFIIIYEQLKNIFLCGCIWSQAIQIIAMNIVVHWIKNYLANIYVVLKQYIYSYIQDFLFTIVCFFYHTYKTDGLLLTIVTLLFYMQSIVVPSTMLRITLIFLSYNFLPELYNTSLSNYCCWVLLLYTIFIWILEISVWLNKEVLVRYLDSVKHSKWIIIINSAILLILAILICVLLILVYFIVHMLYEKLLQYIVMMMGGLFQSFFPGGGQSAAAAAGGGGMPPNRGGGGLAPKGHYDTKISKKRKRDIEACQDNWDIINKAHEKFSQENSGYLEGLTSLERHRVLRDWHLRMVDNYVELNNWQEFGDLNPDAFRIEVDRFYSSRLVQSSCPISTEGIGSARKVYAVDAIDAVNPQMPDESDSLYRRRRARIHHHINYMKSKEKKKEHEGK